MDCRQWILPEHSLAGELCTNPKYEPRFLSIAFDSSRGKCTPGIFSHFLMKNSSLPKTDLLTSKPIKSNDKDMDSFIHIDYIRHLVDSQNGDGTAEVEAYHRALYMNQCGQELEQLKHQIQTHQEKLKYLQPRLKKLRNKIKEVDSLVPVNHQDKPDIEPSQPWNMWDRFMFALAGMGILCLVIFGVLNISYNLIESGIVSFADHPFRAYFWAALLPVGAFAVKVGWDLIQPGSARSVYTWSCLLMGVLGVLVWVLTYASMYPSLSMSSSEQLASLRLFDFGDPNGNPENAMIGDVKWMDMVLVASQALAEIFLSALLGIFMTTVYQRHRPVRLAVNPLHQQWNDEREQLEKSVELERRQTAEAVGREKKMESQLQVFLSYARTLYEKELVTRQRHSHRKHQLLTEIASDLRNRLEEVEAETTAPNLLEANSKAIEQTTSQSA